MPRERFGRASSHPEPACPELDEGKDPASRDWGKVSHIKPHRTRDYLVDLLRMSVRARVEVRPAKLS